MFLDSSSIKKHVHEKHSELRYAENITYTQHNADESSIDLIVTAHFNGDATSPFVQHRCGGISPFVH